MQKTTITLEGSDEAATTEEVSRNVLIAPFGKVVDMLDNVYNWGRKSSILASAVRTGVLRDRNDLYGGFAL